MYRTYFLPRHWLHWVCCEKSAKNDAIRKLNECQSKHYIFFHSSGGHVYRLGYFLHTQLYEVEFVFRPNEKFRKFLFISGNKLKRLNSKLLERKIYIFRKVLTSLWYWQYHFTEENWFKHSEPRRSLKSHSKWQECLSKTLQNIPSIKCRSCETNSVLKYKTTDPMDQKYYKCGNWKCK